MTIKFKDLETAIYHIRVNHLYNAVDEDYKIDFDSDGADTIIMVWDMNNVCRGKFHLTNLVEELEELRNGTIGYCDLWANEIAPY